MDRKTKICIWIILIGLANFLAYTIGYMFIGGEAATGHLHRLANGQIAYVLASGQEVPRGLYIYSGIHSISVWVTFGAVMLAMLTLAKDRIVSSMLQTIVRGRTFITILATIIAFTAIIITIWFVLKFSQSLACPESIAAQSPPARIGQ